MPNNYRFNFFLVLLAVTIIFCNKNSEILKVEDSSPASISGRIVYPDTGLTVYLVSKNGIDSITPDPVTKMFTFDSLTFGLHILQVKAVNFAPFEQKLILGKTQFVFHDIRLTQYPSQITFLDPPNSIFVDSIYTSLYPPPISDSGVEISINFNQYMDSASVIEALVIQPAIEAIQKKWTPQMDLRLFIPYTALGETATLELTLKKSAVGQGSDSLDHDFNIFYYIDTAYMSRIKIEKSPNGQ